MALPLSTRVPMKALGGFKKKKTPCEVVEVRALLFKVSLRQDHRQGRAMALTQPDPARFSAARPRPDPALLDGPGRQARPDPALANGPGRQARPDPARANGPIDVSTC